MIFLQKLGVQIGDGSVGINAAILWLGLGWLVLGGQIEIVATRFILFAVFVGSVALSLILCGQPLGLPALGIMMTMYAGLMFRVRVSYEVAARCLKVFQKCMTVIAGIVVLQQILQYTVGNSFWPNLDKSVPPFLLYPGFAYLRPYSFDSPYFEPNGVFLLEPSAVSLYLAIAVVIEMTWFRNLWRLGSFLIAMVACLAGTGPTTLLLLSPILVAKLNRKSVLIISLVGAPLAMIALQGGWLDTMLSRAGELSNKNSSGYARIILPLQSISRQLDDPGVLLTGWGPGTSPKEANSVQWPFSKLLYEYGFLVAVTFHIYLLVCVLDRPPSRLVSIAMLLPHLFFGGGFVAHANTMPLLLFGSLLAVEPVPRLTVPRAAHEADDTPSIEFR